MARPKKISWRDIVMSILIVAIVVIFFLSFRRDQVVSESFKLQLDKRNRFDQEKAYSGTNYPVCNKLEELRVDTYAELSQQSTFDRLYGDLMRRDLIQCGFERVRGEHLLDKKHEMPWKGCVPLIGKGKLTVLNLLENLCDMQSKANHRYGPVSVQVAAAISKGKNSTAPTTKNWKTFFQFQNEVKRGVVYTGTIDHMKNIFQSITALRMLNVTLPVEVWVNQQDKRFCQIAMKDIPFPKPTNANHNFVFCKSMPNAINHFASKFYAVLSTSFTDVLFLDSDNIPVRDVNEVFDSKEYKSTGAVIWPDIAGERCRGVAANSYHGYSSYRNHIIWVSRLGGLEWSDTRAVAQEAETGQIAFDLRRHGALLEMGRQFIEDGDFLKRIVNGDKDIFRLVFLMSGEQFHFVPHIPGFSTTGKDRDCITHYFGTDESNPMFYHQLKLRQPESFLATWRIPKAHRNDPSVCMVSGWVDDLIGNATASGSAGKRRSLRSEASDVRLLAVANITAAQTNNSSKGTPIVVVSKPSTNTSTTTKPVGPVPPSSQAPAKPIADKPAPPAPEASSSKAGGKGKAKDNKSASNETVSVGYKKSLRETLIGQLTSLPKNAPFDTLVTETPSRAQQTRDFAAALFARVDEQWALIEKQTVYLRNQYYWRKEMVVASKAFFSYVKENIN